jgi:hypothetical protein
MTIAIWAIVVERRATQKARKAGILSGAGTNAMARAVATPPTRRNSC